LRRTAIDELPAVLNVVRGDMSIVGPRAALPLEAAHYSEMQRRRLELKPGLTGYWQVFGREAGGTDFQRMVEMDLEYADKQSLMLDLKILLRTIVMALKSEAAY
jgi:lipopolysaccharide/colanic/teichoic acid biosynthesis glycosyltransferase